MITVFINVIVPVLIVFLLGYILGKLVEIELRTLSTLSLYLLTPALIFQALYQYDSVFSMTSLKIFLSVLLIVILVVGIIEILYRVFHFSRTVRTVLILTIALSNSGNFGLPICEYAYGKEGLRIASLLLVVYSLFTHTLGVFVAASDKGGRKKAFFDMLKVPVFYAMIAALALQALHLKLPKQIFDPVQAIGLAAIPVNLIQLGISLSRVKVKSSLPVVAGAVVAKLIVLPAAALFLLGGMRLTGLPLKVSLVQVAMPSAVYGSILASHYGSDGELASAIVFLSLLGSIVSLTAWIWMLG
jgi:hypothetical protein